MHVIVTPINLEQTYIQHKIKCWKHDHFHLLHNTTMQLSFKKPHENKLINHVKPRPLIQINVVMFENGLLGLLGRGRQRVEK